MRDPVHLIGSAVFAAMLAVTPALTPAAAQGLIFDWGGDTTADSGKQHIRFSGGGKPGDIIVSFSDRKLYHITGSSEADTYPIAIPREQSRWEGVTTVSMKRENPAWTPTAHMLQENPKLPRWVPGGHPMNPLGNRALYLGSSDYRIHGTDAPWTIGTAASKGCVRMFNKDVADLYPRVKVGSKVTVTWQRFDSKVSDATSSPVSSGLGKASGKATLGAAPQDDDDVMRPKARVHKAVDASDDATRDAADDVQPKRRRAKPADAAEPAGEATDSANKDKVAAVPPAEDVAPKRRRAKAADAAEPAGEAKEQADKPVVAAVTGEAKEANDAPARVPRRLRSKVKSETTVETGSVAPPAPSSAGGGASAAGSAAGSGRHDDSAAMAIAERALAAAERAAQAADRAAAAAERAVAAAQHREPAPAAASDSGRAVVPASASPAAEVTAR